MPLVTPLTEGLGGSDFLLQGYVVGNTRVSLPPVRLIYDNIPPSWFSDDPNASALIAAGESQTTAAQQLLAAVALSRYLDTAVGTDLDNCLALVGVTRYGGESDDTFRSRALAVLSSTQNAASESLMAKTLAAAFSEPVLVVTNAAPAGSFTVILLAPPDSVTPVGVRAIIETIRSAGTSYTVFGNIATKTAQLPRLGTFKAGTRRLGAYNAVRIV